MIYNALVLLENQQQVYSLAFLLAIIRSGLVALECQTASSGVCSFHKDVVGVSLAYGRVVGVVLCSKELFLMGIRSVTDCFRTRPLLPLLASEHCLIWMDPGYHHELSLKWHKYAFSRTKRALQPLLWHKSMSVFSGYAAAETANRKSYTYFFHSGLYCLQFFLRSFINELMNCRSGG